MAKNFQPVFALTPKLPGKVISGTTTDKTGATDANIQKFSSFSSDGAKLTRLKFKSVGTTTAGTLMVWIYDTTTTTLQYEQAYGAVTSSSSAVSYEYEFTFNDLQLESGQQIWVGASTVNTNWHVRAAYGELGDNV